MKFLIYSMTAMTLLAWGMNVQAQPHETKFDSVNAFGWFGGDDRQTQGPRHVGVGQSVLIDTSITLEGFSFYFRGPFDFAENPERKGHEVTLTLNVRDTSGTILRTLQTVVPDTFQTGWVTWSGIALEVSAQTTLIFTTYLVGAYDANQFRASHGADANAGYPDGVRYSKNGTSDVDMEDWTDWVVHPWDSAFWLQGTIRAVTSVADEGPERPRGFTLHQNYPNPFNPVTTIQYILTQPAEVSLTVFDTLGRKVRTLVAARQAANSHQVIWNGQDDAGHAVSSGLYFYHLRAGNVTVSRPMVLLQ